MKFTVTVNNGAITMINNSYLLADLSRDMALDLLGEKRFPKWQENAYATACTIIQSNGLKGIILSNELATKENIGTVLNRLEDLFVAFKAAYEIPEVMPDGVYAKETVVVGRSTKRR